MNVSSVGPNVGGANAIVQMTVEKQMEQVQKLLAYQMQVALANTVGQVEESVEAAIANMQKVTSGGGVDVYA